MVTVPHLISFVSLSLHPIFFSLTIGVALYSIGWQVLDPGSLGVKALALIACLFSIWFVYRHFSRLPLIATCWATSFFGTVV
jgi:hypothetical protein